MAAALRYSPRPAGEFKPNGCAAKMEYQLGGNGDRRRYCVPVARQAGRILRPWNVRASAGLREFDATARTADAVEHLDSVCSRSVGARRTAPEQAVVGRPVMQSEPRRRR